MSRHPISRNVIRIALLPLWLLLFLLVVVHELGHILAGTALGFPVTGLEIGHFPYRDLKLFGFLLRIGDFPRGGRTILSFSNRKFERWQQIAFLSSGMIFELFFFMILFWIAKGNVWGRTLLILFFLEELWVNIIPSYEQGLPANDGAHLMEILFPQTALKNRLKN